MNMRGPVRVDPTRPMTKSNLGTDSARMTPIATILDRIKQRLKQKSVTKRYNTHLKIVPRKVLSYCTAFIKSFV